MGLMFKYTAYFNSIVSLLLGIFVLYSGSTKKQNITLFFLSLSISLYAIFFALSIYAPDPVISLLEVRIFHIFCLFLATFFYLFTNEIIFGDTFRKFWHYIPFATSALTAYYLLFGSVVHGVETVGVLPNWTVPGPQFYMYLLHYGFFTTLPIILLAVYYFKTTGIKQNQIKLVLIGAGLALLGGWTTFLPGWGIKVEPYGIHFIFIFQFILAYAILKYQLMDIKMTLSKMGAMLLTFSFYGLAYLFIIIAYFQTVVLQRNIESLGSVAITGIYWLIAGLLFNYLRLRLQTATDKLFLRGKYDYYKELSNASAKVGRKLSLVSILGILYETFHDVVEISNPRIYLPENFSDPQKPSGRYVVYDRKTFSPLINEPAVAADSPLVTKLIASRRTECMIKEIDAYIVTPCMLEDRLIAFFALGPKLSEDPYADEDIRLLEVLASQVAIALDHTRSYEKIRNDFEAAQKKLYDTERQLARSEKIAALANLIQDYNA